MTDTLSVEVARRDNVLRVPTAALRFKPDAGVLAHYTTAATAVSPVAGKGLWVLNGTTIAPVAATAGLSDSSYTELVGSPIGEGALVVIRSSAPGTAPAAPASRTGNPLLPSRPGLGPRG
jgi:HlyD family secretion protein